MKAVYTWDDNNLYIPTANKTVPDDYQLAGNETFDKPEDANGHGLRMPIKRMNSQWIGATLQEYQAAHPAVPVKPSESVQAMNSLGIQVAELTKQNQQLKQSVNALGLQLAQVTMSKKNENGGN